MILSHRYKFIFISNGKTGTTSIEASLAGLQEAEHCDFEVHGLFTKGHIPPSLLKPFIERRIWDDYYKFCFVRNPWDWFVSQFFHNFLRNPVRESVPAELLHERQQCRRLAMEQKDTFTIEDIYDLYDYLKRFRGTPDSDSLFQSSYVYDDKGDRLVDFVGRFESLEADFSLVAKTIGLPLVLPFKNRTAHKPYPLYYSSETRGLLSRLYEVDVENFDYSF